MRFCSFTTSNTAARASGCSSSAASEGPSSQSARTALASTMASATIGSPASTVASSAIPSADDAPSSASAFSEIMSAVLVGPIGSVADAVGSSETPGVGVGARECSTSVATISETTSEVFDGAATGAAASGCLSSATPTPALGTPSIPLDGSTSSSIFASAGSLSSTVGSGGTDSLESAGSAFRTAETISVVESGTLFVSPCPFSLPSSSQFGSIGLVPCSPCTNARILNSMSSSFVGDPDLEVPRDDSVSFVSFSTALFLVSLVTTTSAGLGTGRSSSASAVDSSMSPCFCSS